MRVSGAGYLALVHPDVPVPTLQVEVTLVHTTLSLWSSCILLWFRVTFARKSLVCAARNFPIKGEYTACAMHWPILMTTALFPVPGTVLYGDV